VVVVGERRRGEATEAGVWLLAVVVVGVRVDEEHLVEQLAKMADENVAAKEAEVVADFLESAVVKGEVFQV